MAITFCKLMINYVSFFNCWMILIDPVLHFALVKSWIHRMQARNFNKFKWYFPPVTRNWNQITFITSACIFREEKEKWIRTKYERKEFLQPLSPSSLSLGQVWWTFYLNWCIYHNNLDFTVLGTLPKHIKPSIKYKRKLKNVITHDKYRKSLRDSWPLYDYERERKRAVWTYITPFHFVSETGINV